MNYMCIMDVMNVFMQYSINGYKSYATKYEILNFYKSYAMKYEILTMNLMVKICFEYQT